MVPIDMSHRRTRSPKRRSCPRRHLTTERLESRAMLAAVLWGSSSGGNNHRYEYVDAALSWDDAQATAVARGGHLVTIQSQAESDFLAANVIPSDATQILFGAYQDITSPDYAEPAGGWGWITGEEWDWTNWQSGQPDQYQGGQDGTQEVAALNLTRSPSLRWYDTDNSNKFPYIIEYSDTPPPGFWPSFSGGNDHWYEYVDTALSWDDAQAAAEARGGHLVTIQSQAESDFLAASVIPADATIILIGAFQDTTRPDYSEPAGGWGWITGEEWDWTNWVPGQPGNDGQPQDVAALNLNTAPDLKWYDTGNSNTYPYIIEYSDTPPPWFWTSPTGGNDHWYEYVDTALSWDDAQAAAEARGGFLVTIQSQAESDFLAANVIPSDATIIHIGAFQDTTRPDYSEPAGGWGWITGEEWDWTNWVPGQPANDGGNQQIAALNLTRFPDLKWSDANALVQRAYIIEGSLPGSTLRLRPGSTATPTAPFSGPTAIVTRGAGTLVLNLANIHTGGLRVEEGTVVLQNVDALNGGPLVIKAGAKVVVDTGTSMIALSSLSLDPAGQLDVGTAGITVAAGGFVEADIRQLLVSGRNNGAWDGAAGIVHGSTEPGRAIGYTIDANGVLTIRQTMAGDVDMNGKVDFDDILGLFPNYGTTSGMVWSGGDITYDDKVDFDDILALFPNYGGGSAFSNGVGGGSGTLAGTGGGGGTGTGTGLGGRGTSAAVKPSGDEGATAPVMGPEPPAELGQQTTVTLTRDSGGTTTNDLDATSLAFAGLAEQSGGKKMTDDGGIDPGLTMGL